MDGLERFKELMLLVFRILLGSMIIIFLVMIFLKIMF